MFTHLADGGRSIMATMLLPLCTVPTVNYVGMAAGSYVSLRA